MLQGDGINIHTLEKILDAVLDNGFSAEVKRFASPVPARTDRDHPARLAHYAGTQQR